MRKDGSYLRPFDSHNGDNIIQKQFMQNSMNKSYQVIYNQTDKLPVFSLLVFDKMKTTLFVRV